MIGLEATAKELLQKVSKSFIARYRPESQSTDWGQSLAMYGLLSAYRITQNPDVREYLRAWLAFHLAEAVPVNYFCGSWSFGLLYPEVQNVFPEFAIELKATAERIDDFIRSKAIRNGAGILLHNIDLPNIYIDTLYYASVPLAKLGRALGHEWQTEAFRQVELHLSTLRDGDGPFFIHCQQNNGGVRSEGAWARGNGWVMMTFAELMSSVPQEDESHKKLAEQFEALASQIAPYQSESGLWRTILDDQTAYEEVSATAMFAVAIARGRKLGVLGPQFDEVLQKSATALCTAVNEIGAVMGVSDGTWPGTAEYYKSVGTGEWWWGTGALLLAMSELASD